MKRLARDYEILQQQAAAREARLDELRRELTAARTQLREERQQQSQTFAATIVEAAPCIRSSAVSRDHARLLVAPGSVTLVNVSSTNGCFVNDERVTKQRLRDGDLVCIGDRSFRFAWA